MIVEGKGDLLAADVDALVNTVNCVGVMGKGIALQFKRRYPKVFDEYVRACKRGEVQIGRMLPVETGQMTGPKYVINFPTKKHWRSPSRLEYIKQGLADLRQLLPRLGVSSIAMPPLGTGNGGLNWHEVERLIRQEFESYPVTLILFAPSPGTRPIVADREVHVTPFKALVLHLIASYASQRQAAEPWEDPAGVSHLEIQKLLYFVKSIEPATRLEFKPGMYGPYSDAVRHTLQDMEGTLTIGLGDGSGRVLDFDPVHVTTEGEGALETFMASDPQAPRVRETTARVMRLVEGFEGPYALELLASTHWVMRHSPGLGAEQAAGQVRRWTRRKGRIFTNEHVGTALDHLVTTAA